jgi:hypothetical protein
VRPSETCGLITSTVDRSVRSCSSSWGVEQHHGTANAGAAVTLRLFLVTPAGSMRLLESTIVLSPAGKGGTSTNLTAGGVFGPGTKIGIDTRPLNSQGRLQHAMLHGYLIS